MAISNFRGILLAVLLALGQARLEAQPVSLLGNYSQVDTLRAVKRLFAAKRTGSKIYLGVGLPLTLIGATTALLVATLTSTIKAGEGREKIVPVVIASGSVGLLPSGLGLIRGIRFSRRKEQAILRAYQENKSLPGRVRRHLKPKFFQ